MVFDPTSKTLTIAFDTVEQAGAFKSWLRHLGERGFWMFLGLTDAPPFDQVPGHTDYHSDPNTIRFSAKSLQ